MIENFNLRKLTHLSKKLVCLRDNEIVGESGRRGLGVLRCKTKVDYSYLGPVGLVNLATLMMMRKIDALT